MQKTKTLRSAIIHPSAASFSSASHPLFCSPSHVDSPELPSITGGGGITAAGATTPVWGGHRMDSSPPSRLVARLVWRYIPVAQCACSLSGARCTVLGAPPCSSNKRLRRTRASMCGFTRTHTALKAPQYHRGLITPMIFQSVDLVT